MLPREEEKEDATQHDRCTVTQDQRKCNNSMDPWFRGGKAQRSLIKPLPRNPSVTIPPFKSTPPALAPQNPLSSAAVPSRPLEEEKQQQPEPGPHRGTITAASRLPRGDASRASTASPHLFPPAVLHSSPAEPEKGFYPSNIPSCTNTTSAPAGSWKSDAIGFVYAGKRCDVPAPRGAFTSHLAGGGRDEEKEGDEKR
ncbi:unnamed protein product [Pleuronectes platessa]|uniref:Uncharacterized protein n=1 Tax=Pleuronectes platessa TaxID=8262 RepID=A0A9N7UQF7_PLEPL|nr:unnamed protein product [Pleuronectes platessa]